MDTSTKVEALKHLSLIHRNQFNERYKYIYKILITTLSFYVLSVAVILSDPDILYNIPNGVIFSIYGFVLFVTCVAVTLSHISIMTSRELFRGYESEIHKILESGSRKIDWEIKSKIQCPRLIKSSTFITILWQISIVAVFGVGAGYIVFQY